MEKRRILLLSVLALLAGGCNVLDEKPESRLGKEDLVKDDNTLYLSTLGPLYSLVGGTDMSQGLAGTYRGVYDLETFTSDEAILPTRGGDWYDGGLWQELYLHKWSAGTGPLKDTWNYLYKVVVLANQAIEDLSGKPQWRDEARAFRALYYYELLDLFGRVPIVTSTNVPMSKVSQSSREEVFDFVVGELTSVEGSLPLERSNRPGEWYGRMTRPVVWFLLEKLWLNAPVYAGKEDYGKVAYYCDLLEEAGYGLEENYASNFSVYNESSLENILVIPMDKDLYTAQNQYMFRSRHYDHAAACGFTGENGSSATLEVLEANGFATPDEDPRFELNYWGGQALDLSGNPVPGIVYKPLSIALDITGTPDEKLAGARMKKYELEPSAMKDGKLMDNDWVIFRFADALLMKAEALLRTGELSRALSIVNRVRRRAGAGELTSLTLDDLLRERMIEFAWEGLRRQDLVRFGYFSRSWSSRPSLPGEEDTHYTDIFPIPGDVLALNPLLSQNPGY